MRREPAPAIFGTSMKITSINIGLPREVLWQGETVTTGIFKDPVQGVVRIGKLNLEGDGQADLTVHGGPAKAVYAYPAEHYQYWRQQLPGVDFPWGKFGENLTLQGVNPDGREKAELAEDTVYIGDRMQVGSAILMVTQPRLPCYKLAVKFGRDDMIKRFLVSGRYGFYLSVVEPGEASAGAEISVLSRDPNHVTVADIGRLYLSKRSDPELLSRAINLAALPQSWRDYLKQQAGA